MCGNKICVRNDEAQSSKHSFYRRNHTDGQTKARTTAVNSQNGDTTTFDDCRDEHCHCCKKSVVDSVAMVVAASLGATSHGGSSRTTGAIRVSIEIIKPSKIEQVAVAGPTEHPGSEEILKLTPAASILLWEASGGQAVSPWPVSASLCLSHQQDDCSSGTGDPYLSVRTIPG